MTCLRFSDLYTAEHSCALELLAVGCVKGAEECLELAQGVLDRFNVEGEPCSPAELEHLETLADLNVRVKVLVLRCKEKLAG